MPKGGFRVGAGRPRKGAASAPTIKQIKREAKRAKMQPLEYMLAVMNDPGADDARRDRMAVAAAPYVHARADATGAKGKKEQAQEAAAKAAAPSDDWGDDLTAGLAN